MKIKFNGLWLLVGLAVSSPFFSHAAGLQHAKLVDAEFLKLVPKANNHGKQYIAVSEKNGISLLDHNKVAIAHIPRASEHLDYRTLANKGHVGVIATIEVNSGKLLLAEVDHQQPQLKIKQALQPKNTAFDAVCLSATAYGIDAFIVDVLGQVIHYNAYQYKTKTWGFTEINRFPVGPNVKSCAVDDVTQTLLVAEENIGVWQYSINPEHEPSRELIQIGGDIDIEYVDTTAFGDIAIVSPDKNAIWLVEQGKKTPKKIALAKHISPKTIQLTRIGLTLEMNVYDDNRETLITESISDLQKPNNALADKLDSLMPYAQTDAVKSYGDAADDPEVWVNKKSPELSLVYATNKKYGLNVYDLSGALVTSLPVGRINNIDIRYNVKVNGQRVDLAAASNRTTKSISVFSINKTTGIPTHISDIKTDLADPYGFCLSKNNNLISAWINDTDGRFQRYDLNLGGKQVLADKVLEWQVPSQPEGCVSDDSTQRLFYGEEAAGVWLKQIDGKVADQFIAGLNDEIAADIEGMSLYRLKGQNYLIVSSQGNNRFAVYAVDNQHKFLGVFEIGINWQKLIDGASETDGLAVTHHSLGPKLPHGLMVVQDGHNVMPKSAQNFKLVNGTLLRDWINKKLNTKLRI